MHNPFERALHVGAPGRNYLAVTPNDGADLPAISTSFYVETAGVVRFKSVSGETCTVKVGDYGWIFCGAVRVFATGTTATGIHAITH